MAKRQREKSVHRAAVLAVCAMGGSVDYQSGRYSGDLSKVFPRSSTSFFRSWVPKKQNDFVERITFQRANGTFSRYWIDQDPTAANRKLVAFAPDWSYESMMRLKPHLESFHSPKHLDLGGTRLPRHGLEAISNLASLETLTLSKTQITSKDLVHIGGLVNLKWLSLRRTRIDDDGLRHLANMKQLATLQLGSTRIGDEGVRHLKCLTQLRRLELDNTRITDASLKHIATSQNLTGLRLELTQIADAGVRHLEQLPALKWLSLPIQISSEAMQRIRQRFPNCEVHQYHR